MEVWEIILLALALSMDACAVAMTNGMTNSKLNKKQAVLIGFLFGLFQMMMPLLGFYISGLLADAFLDTFEKISAWVSFILLAFLGIKMLWEGGCECVEKHKMTAAGTRSNEICPCACEKKLTFPKLIMQAIATSIDALAVGVTLQMAAISKTGLALGAWGATGAIGIVTFALSWTAVYIGKLIGDRLSDKAELIGGVVLLGIGIKILIEGLL